MSNVNIETLLYEEIDTEFSRLSELEPGSDEYRATVDSLTKLMDRAIELDKVEVEREDKLAIRENEQELKTRQMKDDKKDRLFKNLTSVASIILPLLVTIWGTKVSLKFEETGSFTTIMGRGFINKLLPKK